MVTKLKSNRAGLLLAGLVLILQCQARPIAAQGREVSIRLSGSHAADDINGLNHKVVFDATYSFVISAKSLDTLSGATLGFTMYSPDNSLINAQLSVPQFTTAWSDLSVWDLGGALSDATQLGDGVLPDRYLTGGAAFPGAGFQQDVLTDIVTFDVTFGPTPGVFCVDSLKFPPSGDWLFSGFNTVNSKPEWTGGVGDLAVGGTSSTAFCVTVFAPPDDPPVFTLCPGSAIGGHCPLIHYFVEATDPEGVDSITYSAVTTGNGVITTRADGRITYAPTTADVGAPVSVTVTASEPDGPSTTCVTNVTVTNSSPTVACPQILVVAPGEVDSSAAPTVSDADNCDAHTFSLVSVTPTPPGQVSINAATGVVTYASLPGEPLEVSYTVCVAANDGFAERECCFELRVSEGCCVTPGDANHDGSVNISDVVYMIAWIFQIGPKPPCADEGDFNADGELNIRDVVQPIDYIFRGGPPPTCGPTGQ